MRGVAGSGASFPQIASTSRAGKPVRMCGGGLIEQMVWRGGLLGCGTPGSTSGQGR